MGDVVFTLPAVHLLRENFPQARISFLTSTDNQGIVAGFTEVDEVIVQDLKAFKQPGLKRKIGTALSLARRVRRGKFSLVLDLQFYTDTAILSWITRAPNRWGFRIGKRFRRFAYTRCLPRAEDRHPVDANIHLLTEMGLKMAPVRWPFRPAAQGREEANQLMAEHRLEKTVPLIFFQPFTSTPKKNWPLERYLAVARHWREKGMQVAFGGGVKDKETLAPATSEGFAAFTGYPLSTVAWLLEPASLVVGGDTGLMHLALAMGKRLCMLVRPLGWNGTPYGHPEWVIAPDADDEIGGLPVEKVNQGIANALAEQRIGLAVPQV
jgi:ADP-heptose:LPS heptosyltransferase